MKKEMRQKNGKEILQFLVMGLLFEMDDNGHEQVEIGGE
jgi:hypothetical protein